MQIKIIEKHFGGVEFTPEMPGAASGRTEQRERGVAGVSAARELAGQECDAAHPAAGRHDAITDFAGRKQQLCGGQGVYGFALRAMDAAGAGRGRIPGTDAAGKIRLLRDTGHRRRRGDQPTQYETFVAQVVGYSNAAQNSAKEARNAAAAAKQDANKAEAARMEAATAASEAGAAQSAAEGSASRAERAAAGQS